MGSNRIWSMLIQALRDLMQSYFIFYVNLCNLDFLYILYHALLKKKKRNKASEKCWVNIRFLCLLIKTFLCQNIWNTQECFSSTINKFKIILLKQGPKEWKLLFVRLMEENNWGMELHAWVAWQFGWGCEEVMK